MAPLMPRGRNPVTVKTDTGRLSSRGKGVTLTFIAIGLLTFVLPIIKLDAPVHGQQYWSVLDLTLQMQARLHLDTPLAVLPFVPFALVYLTLLVAMGMVLVVPLRKPLRWVSVVGLYLLHPFRGFFGGVRLGAFLEYSKGGGFVTLWILLGIAMLAVAAVAWTDATT
jgi:hypothetical protein